MIADSHCCPIRLAGRRQWWWTCPDCGQLWRRVGRDWKLAPREPQA